MNAAVVPRYLKLWGLVEILDPLALVVGGFAALTGHRWGAYVLLANLVVRIGSHLLVGRWAYRDVMARPWPKVAPLDDWDD
jgi:hypothetical protein